MNYTNTLFEVWTDGACKGNPGPGGWGVYIRCNGQETYLKGGELDTTNNRMEMMAVIKALRALPKACKVHLYTDSTYVRDGISKWIDGWVRNGWRTSSRTPVKNQDLWELIESMRHDYDIEWIWVKGHTQGESHAEKGNLIADQLANEGVPTARS